MPNKEEGKSCGIMEVVKQHPGVTWFIWTEWVRDNRIYKNRINALSMKELFHTRWVASAGL